MANWRKLFEVKEQKDPIKKAKGDLFCFAYTGGFCLLLMGVLFWIDGKPDLRDALGIEVYSRISIALLFALGVLYVSFAINPLGRLLDARKAKPQK